MQFEIRKKTAFHDNKAPIAFSDALETGLELAGSLKQLKAGETLYFEADSDDYCYQVVSGVVKEYNTLEDGRRQVADFYSEGDMFGLSEHCEQLHTAEALTASTIRCYPRAALMQAITATPSLSSSFLQTLMTRLHRTRERMVMIGRMTAMQRVASFLSRLADDQSVREDVQIVMSRQDIADHLGLTIETVCRALTALKREKIVSMKSARVFTIINEDALEAMVRRPQKRVH